MKILGLIAVLTP